MQLTGKSATWTTTRTPPQSAARLSSPRVSANGAPDSDRASIPCLQMPDRNRALLHTLAGRGAFLCNASGGLLSTLPTLVCVCLLSSASGFAQQQVLAEANRLELTGHFRKATLVLTAALADKSAS